MYLESAPPNSCRLGQAVERMRSVDSRFRSLLLRWDLRLPWTQRPEVPAATWDPGRGGGDTAGDREPRVPFPSDPGMAYSSDARDVQGLSHADSELVKPKSWP